MALRLRRMNHRSNYGTHRAYVDLVVDVSIARRPT